MANELRPNVKGRVLPDAVSVLVGGKTYDGWQTVAIQKSIKSIANSFSISLHDRFAGLQAQWPLKPGVSTKVNIGQERVITGRIEKLDVNYQPGSRGFTISGRSKPGDLVDCSHTGKCEYKNITLDALARELVAPFGIKVFLSVDTPDIIAKVAVKPGETVFEVLDRQARLQGFFWISTRGGNIRLTRAGRLPSFSSLSQDINIEGATASFDDSKRHNEYLVKGQGAGLPDFFAKDVTQPEGQAKDAGVTRHRPLVILAEGNVDSAKAKIRAQWEASSRLAKAIRVTCTVDGWTQEDGSLWGINQITHLKSAFLGINGKMLISDLIHKRANGGGTTTDLTLVDPQSYALKPVLNDKKDSDIMASLGANFS